MQFYVEFVDEIAMDCDEIWVVYVDDYDNMIHY